jgi:hypothetical protein
VEHPKGLLLDRTFAGIQASNMRGIKCHHRSSNPFVTKRARYQIVPWSSGTSKKGLTRIMQLPSSRNIVWFDSLSFSLQLCGAI